MSIPGPTPGMIRIGRSPARTGLLPLLLATGVGSAILASLTVGSGSSPLAFAIAFAISALLILGGILLFLTRYYRPVAFDPVSGMARLGRMTVPVTSVVAAHRKVSAGATSAYLSYRFTAANGAWGRVLVAGNPIRGLRPEDVPLLEQFVTATAIADPPGPAGHPWTQLMVADQIGVDNITQFRSYTSKRQVGKAELLAELRGQAPQPVAAEPDSLPADLRRQWEQDDREAADVVLRSAADTWRRIAGWATVAVAAAWGAGLLVMAVVEENGALDTRARDAGVGYLAVTAALGLLCYIGFASAAAASARHAQRAVLAWLRTRDDQQVTRGLPRRLLLPFLGNPPGYRLRMAGGIAGLTVGGIGLISGAASLAMPDTPGLVPAVLLVAGVAVTWLGAWLFCRTLRAPREQRLLAARLGGRRLAGQLSPG